MRPSWVHYAVLIALVGAAILAPIGAIALAAWLVFMGVRYFKAYRP